MTSRRRLLARRVDLPGRVIGRGRPGTRAGRHAGAGSEILASRAYTDGDDVKRVDWNATARTGELHVKSTLADISRPVTIAIDTSSSMRTGSCRRKIDVAVDAACFVAEIAAAGNERCRLLLTGRPPVVLPAGSRAVAAIEALVTVPDWGCRTELDAGTGPASGQYLVVITDLFAADGALRSAALRTGGGLLVIEVTDPAEIELPAAGRVRLTDPERDIAVDVDTRGAAAVRYRHTVADRRRQRRRMLEAAGAALVSVSTTEEVDVALAGLLPRRR